MQTSACECDNTHKQNDTVCQWCWAHGRRLWCDPEVPESASIVLVPKAYASDYQTLVEVDGKIVLVDFVGRRGEFPGNPPMDWFLQSVWRCPDGLLANVIYKNQLEQYRKFVALPMPIWDEENGMWQWKISAKRNVLHSPLGESWYVSEPVPIEEPDAEED